MEYKTEEYIIKVKCLRVIYLDTKNPNICTEIMPLCKSIFSDLIMRTNQAATFMNELDCLCKEEKTWQFWKETRLKKERSEVKLDIKMIADSLIPLPEFCQSCMNYFRTNKLEELPKVLSVIIDRLSTMIDIVSSLFEQLIQTEFKLNCLLKQLPEQWLQIPGIKYLPGFVEEAYTIVL